MILVMDVLVSVYLFLIGLCFGSFALVVADRMKIDKDWVRGRSACEYCKKVLAPKDLVPLFSWLSTGGKCRYCHKSLSVFYPLAELGLGLAFLLSYVFLPYELSGQGFVLFGMWLFGLITMCSLVVFDLRWYLLPSKLVYPLIGLAFVHRVVDVMAHDQPVDEALIGTFLAVLVGSGLFWSLHWLSKGKWIGDGDYRLGMAIALFLGDPLVTWAALFFASIIGLLVSAPMIMKSKDKMRLKIPFGPFLIGGLYFAYLFGERLIDWYGSTFLYL